MVKHEHKHELIIDNHLMFFVFNLCIHIFFIVMLLYLIAILSTFIFLRPSLELFCRFERHMPDGQAILSCLIHGPMNQILICCRISKNLHLVRLCVLLMRDFWKL